MASLVIPIHQLDNHGKDYVFALDQAWLDGAFEGSGVRGDAQSGVGQVSVHAQRNGSEILIHGRAHACLLAECGRCLNDVPFQVACDLAALFAPQKGARRETEDDEDIDPDAPDREFYTGEEIVIDDLVRDYLLLELPMHARCEDAADGRVCGGLDVLRKAAQSPAPKAAQEFGEVTIDPRLLPLMKLAKGERDKE